jgi:hypothetical protein
MSYVKITFLILRERAIIRNYSCRLKLSPLEGANWDIHCKRVIFMGASLHVLQYSNVKISSWLRI